MQDFGVHMIPAPEAGTDGFRLRKQPSDVLFEEVRIGGVNQRSANPLFETTLRRQAFRPVVPAIVVLAHRVIEPADMFRMPNGITREPECDDLIDARPFPRHADVGQPVRQVRRSLPAESIGRRGDDVGDVAGFAKGGDERARDDQVSAFGERRRGGDDQNA